MTIQIEEGKFYRAANGHRHGPMRRSGDRRDGLYAYVDDTFSWGRDGTHCRSRTCEMQLVAEWVDEPAASIPELMQDLAATEKAARVIYLSGPMNGYPQSNYTLFNAVAWGLRTAGHRVYNPAEFDSGGAAVFPLRKAFAEYAAFITGEADTIVLLPGWENSVGANAELGLAKACRLDVVKLDDIGLTINKPQA